MLVPMAKVEIVGHRRQLDATLALLQQRGVMQLIATTDVPGLAVSPLGVEESHLQEAEELRHLRTRIDAFLEFVPSTPGSGAEEPVVDVHALRAELDELAPEVERMVQHLDDLEQQQSVLPRHIESLRRLLPLVPEIPELETYETVALLIDRRHAAVTALLREELTAICGTRFEIISAPVDPHTLGAVLVFPRQESQAVHALLAQEQVSRVRLPDQFRGLTLTDAVIAMEERTARLPTEIETTRAALENLLRPHTHWHRSRADLNRRLDQLDVLGRVGATQRAFVMVGWVPRPELDGLDEALRAGVGPEVLLNEMDREADDEPPSLLANLSPARPFQLFVNLLSLPRYGTIDPTVLMTLFIPLLFGMMLGDVGYGVSLLALSIWIGRRWGPRSAVVSDLVRVIGLGALWAIVWGVVYGEVFGDLGRRLFDLQPLWVNREEAIEPLFLLAVAFGAFHIVLGLVLGLWVAARSHNRRLFGERAALLLALTSLFLIVAVAADRLPSGVMTPAVAGVLVGLVILVVVQGPLGLVMGPLSLLGVITNVLSYLRIAAIGLATVFLARVANELGAAAPLLLGLIIAALFHALNLALGAFSPTIQALRLHYVEFFDKFYEPGGGPFEPFAPAPEAPVAVEAQPRPLVGTASIERR